MAYKNNARCAICDGEYYVCQSCKEFLRLEPWKIHTDTSECYKVFQIIHGYSTGIYDKAEAKEKLNNVDLSKLNTFKENIQSIINDIMAYTVEVPDTSKNAETTETDKEPIEIVTPKKKSKKKNK